MSSDPVPSLTAGLRPEARLLLCCGQISPDLARAARIHARLQERIDWGYLIRLARAHGMLPLLGWQLSATNPEGVPQPLLDRLRGEFCSNAVRSLVLVHELFTVLELLAAHGVHAIPFKGPVLAASLYGNVTLREAGDLDILIRASDAAQAGDLLIAQGYDLETALKANGRLARPGTQENRLVHPETHIVVELRWEILPPHLSRSLTLEHLWTRRGSTTLGERALPDLPPEDLLPILCAHGTKHHWCRLLWLVDIAELVRRLPK